MKRVYHIVVLAIIYFAGHQCIAQDAKAKGILDKLSNKASSYTSIIADFEYKMENKGDGINESQNGSLETKGEKYKFEIAGQIVISDGKTVWTVLEDAEEVQVNEVPEEDESEDYINPINVLTLWEKGFKYKYDRTISEDGISLDIIDLYPDNPDEKSFHTVKLYVDQKEMIVRKIEIKGKDGTNFTYKIKSFTPNTSIESSHFQFIQSEYPDFEVIDLR